jgi:hypothetical protein
MTHETKECCGEKRVYINQTMDMNIDNIDIEVCPYCGSYEKHEYGTLYLEDAWNWIGLSEEEVKRIPIDDVDEVYHSVLKEMITQKQQNGEL